MFLLCHEDAHGMEFGEPRTFDTKAEAKAFVEVRPEIVLHAGHALVLYECRYVETLREAVS